MALLTAKTKVIGWFFSFGTRDYHSYTTEAGSSSMTDEQRFDPLLDRAMMQTITDVKYVKRRPKFTAVCEFLLSVVCRENFDGDV